MPQGYRIQMWKRRKVSIPLRGSKIERKLRVGAAHSEIPQNWVLEEKEMMGKSFSEFARRLGNLPAGFKQERWKRRGRARIAIALGVLRRWRE